MEKVKVYATNKHLYRAPGECFDVHPVHLPKLLALGWITKDEYNVPEPEPAPLPIKNKTSKKVIEKAKKEIKKKYKK